MVPASTCWHPPPSTLNNMEKLINKLNDLSIDTANNKEYINSDFYYISHYVFRTLFKSQLSV